MNEEAKLSIIAAIGENRELGKENRLLWHIPEDMQWFRAKTRGHPVIMGRLTYESIGRALPNRDNIVVTRDHVWEKPDIFVKYSVDEAVFFAKERSREEIFIIGGGQIYEATIDYADRLYLTVIHHKFDKADTFFPEYSQYTKEIYRRNSQDENYEYTFLILERGQES